MDLVQATNTPRDFAISGVTYKVRALKAAEWGLLHAWLVDHAVDPFTWAVRQIAKTKALQAPITLEQEDYLLSEGRKAAEVWPPQASSPAWFDILARTEGGEFEFLKACLKACQPGMEDDEIREVARLMDPDAAGELVWVALGKGRPKAEAPNPTTKSSNSSTTRKRRLDPTKMTGRRSSKG